MAANKTTETDASVAGFVSQLDSEKRKDDSWALIAFMERVSGHKAKMWGGSIIGFGRYHYRYDSGHQGDAPLIGFSPRKAAISLYVYTGMEEHAPLLEGLGHQKMGAACLYVNKVANLNQDKLETLCRATISFLESKYAS